MEIQKEIIQIQRMFAYQELRDKDNLTRAIYLVMNNLGKITHVAQACSVSPQSIYRGIKAIQEGRSISVHGRCSIFTAEQESDFKKEIIDFINQGGRATFENVRSMVNILHITLSINFKL